jgi:hypothetical protein
MKESHRKSLAHYPDPESCVVRREAAIEALTGAHLGRVLSCEISVSIGVPTVFRYRKATLDATLRRVAFRTLRSRRPRHAGKLHAREPGDPRTVRGD